MAAPPRHHNSNSSRVQARSSRAQSRAQAQAHHQATSRAVGSRWSSRWQVGAQALHVQELSFLCEILTMLLECECVAWCEG
jgi:hypothetical protein